MATGTKINNNFDLLQKKPLDERTTTRGTVAELSQIRYPHPNLRVYVAGTVNKWHEYKLVNGSYAWVADGATTVVSYNDLGDLPRINNHEITGDLTLDDLEIQPKGAYLTEASFDNYYPKDKTLSTEEINNGFPTKTYFEQKLGEKISAAEGYRLMSTEEGTKIGESATTTDLEALEATLVHKNTTTLPTVIGFSSTSTEIIRLYDETKGTEYKIKLSVLFSALSQGLTAKPLSGTKNGENDTFTCNEFVAGTTAVYVSGVKKFLNVDFVEVSVPSATSIRFNSYLPEPLDVLMIEAIWV